MSYIRAKGPFPRQLYSRYNFMYPPSAQDLWAHNRFGWLFLGTLGIGGFAAILASEPAFADEEVKPQAPPDAGWRTTLRNNDVTRLEDNRQSGGLLSSKVISHVDRSGLGLRLYQYAACPYCCKVRTFLDYYGFSYETIEVHPVWKTALRQTFGSAYKKVPVLSTKCCEGPLVESTQIISMLATFLVQPKLHFDQVPALYDVGIETNSDKKKPSPASPNQYFVMYGDTPLNDAQIQLAREEREWRQWVDDTFIDLISLNVAHDLTNTFSWFAQAGEWHENFSRFDQWLAKRGGKWAMRFFLDKSKLRERRGIEKNAEHIMEKEEYIAMKNAIKEWMNGKGPHRPFMGGIQPGLADLSFFGACKAFMGTYVFEFLYAELPEFRTWFDGVNSAVCEGRGRILLERKCRELEAPDALPTTPVEKPNKKTRGR